MGRIRLGVSLAGALWLFALTTLALDGWGTAQRMHEKDWQYDRARIAAELGRSGQRHLVIGAEPESSGMTTGRRE